MYGCKRLVDAGEGRVAEARIEKKYLVLDRKKLHEALILHCSATAVLQQCHCIFPLFKIRWPSIVRDVANC